MNTQLISARKQPTVLKPDNKEIADEFIRRYQTSTKNAIESILNMGEAVYEIYMKSKSGVLSSDDLEYFCKTVSLDLKGDFNKIGRSLPLRQGLKWL